MIVATCPVEAVAEPSHARAARSITVFSGLVWLLIAFAPLPGIGAIERWLLLAILVLVPLSLSLVPAPLGRLESVPLRIAVPLLLVGEPAALASFAVPTGTEAALFTLPWLVVAVLLALLGLARLIRLHPGRADQACLSVGLLYLPLGAGWLTLARLGAEPLGLPGVVVLLTAVHFHYAGLLAPLIAAQVGLAVRAGRPGLWPAYRWLALGVMVGPALVALGITSSRLVEIPAVLILALSLAGLALLTLALLGTVHPWLARPFLLVSSLALLGGMVLAAGYGLGHPATHVATPALAPDMAALGIPEMATWHGALQSLGFVLCALLGWTLVQAWAALPAMEAAEDAALAAELAAANAAPPAVPEHVGRPAEGGYDEDARGQLPAPHPE